MFELLAAVAPSLPLQILALVPLGAVSVTFAAGVNSSMQLAASPEMRGRVMSLYSVVFLGSTPIGAPLVGWLAEVASPRAGLALGGAAALVAAVGARAAYARHGEGILPTSHARRFRFGLIVPSSNVTMETEIPALLREREERGFTFHSSRMRMRQVTPEELQSMNEQTSRAAAELADARCDVVATACLVALMAQGPGYHCTAEDQIREVLRAEGAAAPVVSSAGALLDGLRALGATRIAMVTPYEKPLTRKVADYIEAGGVEVHDALSLEVADNQAVAALDPADLQEHWKRLDLTGCDALVLSACVQMPSLASIDPVERECGLPVLSAATATTFAMLDAVGLAHTHPARRAPAVRRGRRARLSLSERHAGRHARLDEPRAVRGDALAERLAQRLRVGHASARHAVALGHRGDLERRQVEAGRAGDLLDLAEPLEDRVLLVAQDQEGDRHVVGGRGPQPLDRVLRRALAEHAHDRPVGLGHLHADRRPGSAKPSPPPAVK